MRGDGYINVIVIIILVLSVAFSMWVIATPSLPIWVKVLLLK